MFDCVHDVIELLFCVDQQMQVCWAGLKDEVDEPVAPTPLPPLPPLPPVTPMLVLTSTMKVESHPNFRVDSQRICHHQHGRGIFRS